MNKLRDLHHDSKGKVGFARAAISTDTATNGAIIDMQGYEGLEFYVSSETLTDGLYILSLQDGDASNLSDAAAVDSEQVFGAGTQFALTDDGVVKRIGYHGNKRYVRLVITSSAVTTGGAFSAVAVNFSPLHAPVAND